MLHHVYLLFLAVVAALLVTGVKVFDSSNRLFERVRGLPIALLLAFYAANGNQGCC